MQYPAILFLFFWWRNIHLFNKVCVLQVTAAKTFLSDKNKLTYMFWFHLPFHESIHTSFITYIKLMKYLSFVHMLRNEKIFFSLERLPYAYTHTTGYYQVDFLQKELNKNLTSVGFRSWITLLKKLLDGLPPTGFISRSAKNWVAENIFY